MYYQLYKLYAAIIGGFLLVALLCYVLLTAINNYRLGSHIHYMSQGSLELIAQELLTQNKREQQQWLKKASEITNIKFKLLDQTTHGNQIGIQKKIFSNVADIYYPLNAQYLIHASISSYDIDIVKLASLIIFNKLLVLPVHERQPTLSSYQSYINYPVNIVQLDDVDLGLYSKRQLDLGNMIVDIPKSSNKLNSFNVLARYKDSQQVLYVGNIDFFVWYPAWLMFAIVSLGILVFTLLVLLILHRSSKRLNLVVQSINSMDVQQGKYSKIRGNDIPGILARHLDDMQQRINKMLYQQKHIMQALAHELRTPLARMKFKLEDYALTAQENVSLNQDIDAVEKLVHEILTYSTLEQTNVPASATIMMQDVVSTALKAVAHLSAQNNVCIDVDVPANIAIVANDALLIRMLENLLINACKYASHQVEVKIAPAANLGEFVLAIHDDGVGIEAKHYDEIFSPFVRIPKYSNNAIKGYGMGLAIVAQIVKMYQGHVKVTKSELGGACFIISLPFYAI